jgi:hypothetical protein
MLFHLAARGNRRRARALSAGALPHAGRERYGDADV